MKQETATETKRNKWQERIEAERFLAELVKAGFVVPKVVRTK